MLADEEMQAIERYIFQSAIYVAETGGIVIAVYALYPIDEHSAEIKAIAVNEAWQNQGIGKLLLKDAETRATEQGFCELIIGTPTIAGKQLAIYKRAGFELFEIKKGFFLTYYSAPIFEDGVRLTDMVYFGLFFDLVKWLASYDSRYFLFLPWNCFHFLVFSDKL
ncbi:GNAT family N-acetyltransferase [Mucilaginibacter sp. P25]|uniref:GNAT family N-acetyltransferase n=1 Tax=unclassified Mucilaginibacter TaxID=2617802 RepID=UPI003D66A8B4